MKNLIEISLVCILISLITSMNAQQVEVQGALKVTQMNPDENGEILIIKNTDGTLGTRSVASLPPPPPPIDTTRNLASDFELAKTICNCPNLPPFLVQSLLESGYTKSDLLEAGIKIEDINYLHKYGTLVDSRDGQAYNTVKIGEQTWMAENLNFGTRIDDDNNATDNNIVEKYCYDDNPFNCTTYGGLYQWDEIMQYSTTEFTQGICPTGWHLPSDNEFKTLEMQLGMSQAQADAINYRGTDQGSQLADNELLWYDGSLDQNAAFGTSGFAVLPSGYRYALGSYINQPYFTFLWSSSLVGDGAWCRGLNDSTPKVLRNNINKFFGLSVRCVRD